LPPNQFYKKAYGLQGSITEIPAGFTLSYIVSASSGAGVGVNEAFEEWGDKLLGTYGKSREVSYRDYSLNYLGYETRSHRQNRCNIIHSGL